MAVFWDVALCSQGDRPRDGGRKHFWIFGQFLPDYTAQHTTSHLQIMT
jgi:hypothetical protein